MAGTAVEYLAAMKQRASAAATAQSLSLARHQDRHTFDASPARVSDLFIPNFVSAQDAAVQGAVHDSAFLDALAPALLKEETQAVASYYADRHSLLRYWPMNSIEGNVAGNWDVTQEPWYAPSGPQANPNREATCGRHSIMSIQPDAQNGAHAGSQALANDPAVGAVAIVAGMPTAAIRSKQPWKELGRALLYLSPALFFLIVFTYIPFLRSL